MKCHDFSRNPTPDPLDRRERTDHDVIAVRISECEFHSSSGGIHVGLFLKPSDERARPGERQVKIIDPEEQEETVARLGVIGARQAGMIMGAPRVQAEQDRSIRIEDLSEVVVSRRRLRHAE